MSYLAYHLHWNLDQLMDLEHGDRVRLVDEVAGLNARVWRRFAMCPSGAPAPPFAGKFVFEVDGVEIGAFSEVSRALGPADRRGGDRGGQQRVRIRLPGALKWQNLVLKRGVTDSNSLFEWITSCSGEGFAGNQNKVKRLTGSVVLYDSMAAPVRQWDFHDAMPVRWSGPQLAAGSNALAQEELEVSHGGFKIA